tara:strand:- start:15215 stop:15460 length:246 start_codon:yes stop_codon:yes gene_type:complete
MNEKCSVCGMGIFDTWLDRGAELILFVPKDRTAEDIVYCKAHAPWIPHQRQLEGLEVPDNPMPDCYLMVINAKENWVQFSE